MSRVGPANRDASLYRGRIHLAVAWIELPSIQVKSFNRAQGNP